MEGRPLATQHRDADNHTTYHLDPWGAPEVIGIIEKLRKENDGAPHPSTLVTIELLEHLQRHSAVTPVRWFAYENPQPPSDAFIAGTTHMVTLLRVHNIEV